MPQSRAEIEAEITRLQGELEDATDEAPPAGPDDEQEPEYEDVEAEIRGQISTLTDRLDRLENPETDEEEEEEETENDKKGSKKTKEKGSSEDDEEEETEKKSQGKRKRQSHKPADEHPWFKKRLRGRV